MLKKSPSQSELNNLVLLLNSGDFSAAEASAKSLGKTYPKAVVVWKILGVAIAEQGNMADAIDPLKKVVMLAPKDAEAHRNLATALKEIGQIKTAEAHFRTSISLDPNDALSHISLAKILNEKDDFTNAEKLCLKAITLKYDMAEAHDQLGIALLGQKKITAAETSFRTAILLNPNMADAHNNLGIALNEQGKYSEADASYRQALALNPDFANAYNNMATNYYAQRKLLDAETLLLQAIALKPNFPDALNTLGNIYKDLNRIDESIAYFRKAITIEPAMNIAHSNLLLTAGYNAKLSQEEALDEAKAFGINASARVKNKYTKWNCKFPIDTTSGKIKVGFVSGDFRKHAVAFFIEGLFRNFNKDKFELFAYTTQPQEDDITALLKPNFAKWQPIYGKNNEVAAAIIHQDAPHILFDLSGHTAGNRLPMFAYKPAPIQVTWLGYPATTGMTEMDYILANHHLIPVGQEQPFVEKVWRLPEVVACFSPLIEDIPIAAPPSLQNNYTTFGCFNNLIKMSDNVVATWSQILHAVPNSKLHLQTKQLSEQSVLERTYARYSEHGITPDRLILEGITARLDYFKSYNKIDIALDPFPCTGGTTTADTLWMSVPVLTMKGRDFWSRLGEAPIHYAGLQNWIAEDEKDYINKAAAFAADRDYLATLRSEQRDNVMASSLFDAARFTTHFETALTEMVMANQSKFNQ